MRSKATTPAVLPAPHYGTCLHFYRENTSVSSFLVDSLWIAPTHAARRSQQLTPFFLFFFGQTQKSDLRGIRTPESTLLVRLIAVEGKHQVTEATGSLN